MTLFDDNVASILSYSSTVPDPELRHDILVALIKDKATYEGEDLFAKFYSNPYGNGYPHDEKEAGYYLIAIHLLKKLHDVASARGMLDRVHLTGRPDSNAIEKIKEKIENI